MIETRFEDLPAQAVKMFCLDTIGVSVAGTKAVPAYASGSGELSSRTPSCIKAAMSASDMPRMSRQT